jgi:hypothetical protein
VEQNRMQLFLAILMTVAQLAGPWLCCCGPTRAVAAIAGLASNRPPVDDSTSSGCPHCKKEAPTCPPTKNRPKHSHTPDRCPCGGMLTNTNTTDKPSVPTPNSLLVVVSAEPSQMMTLVAVAPLRIVGLRELPLLTTADRLFGHHVLRC